MILQGSAGARKYAGEPVLRHLVKAAVEAYPEIPIVMHQDHGASPSVCMMAIRSGVSSVMMDGSLQEDAKTPAGYDYNVAVTRKLVEMPMLSACRWGRSLVASTRSKPRRATRRMVMAQNGKLTKAMLLTDPGEVVRYEAFGAAGQASKIRPVPLERMAQVYGSGELCQRVE